MKNQKLAHILRDSSIFTLGATTRLVAASVCVPKCKNGWRQFTEQPSQKNQGAGCSRPLEAHHLS